PARGEHRTVRAPQHHAVARYQAHVVDEHARDPARVRLQIRLGPTDTLAAKAEPVAGAPGYPPVQKRGSAVETLRKIQFGSIEEELRLLFNRRHMILRGRVDVRRGRP